MRKNFANKICVFALAMSPFLVSSAPAAADDADDCMKLRGPMRLEACTRVTKSGRYQGVDLAWAYVNIGHYYGDVNELDRAIEAFSEAIRLRRDDRTFRNRADIYVRKNDLDKALADFNEALRINPKNYIAMNGRGLLYFRRNDPKRALADFNEAIKLDPTNSQAFNNRAFVYLGQNEYLRALDDLDEALKLRPGLATTYHNRGTLHERLANTDRALADYSQAIKLNPKFVDALKSRANLYEKRSNAERAIADLDAAIALAPEHIELFSDRCLVRAKAGRELDLALADCERAVSLRPDNWVVRASRGFAYLRLNRADEAITDYDTSLKSNPANAFALYGRAIAKTRKGDKAGGNADLATAKRIDPKIESEFARYGLRP